MTSKAFIEYNIGEWFALENVMPELIKRSPHLKRKFLERVTSQLRIRLYEQIGQQSIRTTGTYDRSIRLEVQQISKQESGIFVGFRPIGSEAERLPIYWKVLEFGSKKNPSVPRKRLAMWGAKKLGSEVAGFQVASAIRRRGVKPHPILKRFFILSESGDITDISLETRNLIRREGELILEDIANQGVQLVLTNKGRSVSARRGRGFIPFADLNL